MQQGYAPSEGMNAARLFALVLGLGYLGAGAVGFFETGFASGFVADTNARLLGFDLNIFHNVVHVAIGLGLLVAWRASDVTITQGVLIGVGLFYVLAAILGFINYLQIISINDSIVVDNFFHAITGAIALTFGLVGAKQQNDSMREAVVPGGAAMAADGPLPIEERRALWDEGGETYREETY